MVSGKSLQAGNTENSMISEGNRVVFYPQMWTFKSNLGIW